MREHAHQLLDRLDPSRLAAVVHILEAVIADDSDTLSASEAASIAEADEWSRNHALIPHSDVLSDLGLSVADWEKLSAES